jgi:XTP/dITP diphosphohydrolase
MGWTRGSIVSGPRRYHGGRVSELLLASQNPGKLNEMRLLVEGLPFRVVGPRELGILEAPDETGATFAENAAIKALAYARLSGRLTVADDSGLSVDALDGAPGLYSSRFGGEGATDRDRNLLLLEKLRGVPFERRGARFTSAVAVARGSQLLFEAQESVFGVIAEATRGESGFGYDPLFFYPPYDRTFGEVSREEKDRVSHRGKAFARLREFLAGWPT